jgi:hypothetical protein
MDVFVPPDEPTVIRATFLQDHHLLRRSTRLFYRKHKTARPQQMRLLIFALLGGVFFASGWVSAVLLDEPSSVGILGMFVGAPFLLMFTLAAWMIPTRLLTATMKLYERVPGLLGGHVIEISPSSLTVSNTYVRSTWRLEKLFEIDIHPDLILVSISTVHFVSIPADADFGSDTFEKFGKKLVALYEEAKARGAQAVTAPRGV